MKERKLTTADLILLVGTRVALGVGIGLLLSPRLNRDQRKAAGLVLALIGGLSSIPLAMILLGKKDSSIPQIEAAA